MCTIPKIIHYVWPGKDKKTDLAEYCIKSWYKNIPSSWQIKEWNPDTLDFDQLAHDNKFFCKMLQHNLYAFMSDYIRCHILYQFGGIYLDTDIELLRPIPDEMLSNSMILPIQEERFTEPALWGAAKDHTFIKLILDFYSCEIWDSPEYLLPEIIRSMLKNIYRIVCFPAKDKQKKFSTPDALITFYPEEYFVPFRYVERFLPTCITQNTVAIHWFKASWKNNAHYNLLHNKAGENTRKAYEIALSKQALICNLRNRILENNND